MWLFAAPLSIRLALALGVSGALGLLALAVLA